MSDIGAIQTTYTLNTDTFQQLQLDYNPINIRWSLPLSLVSVFSGASGNIYPNYQDSRIHVTLEWPDNYYITFKQFHKLVQLYRSLTYQRWFLGEYISGVNAFYRFTGSFDDTENKIYNNGESFIPDQWKGFWITFDSKSFIIISNTATELFLADPDDAGYPSAGSYQADINFLEMQIEKSNILEIGGYYKALSQGQRLYDDEEDYRYSLKGLSISLVQHVRSED